jgi:hypothetical protein
VRGDWAYADSNGDGNINPDGYSDSHADRNSGCDSHIHAHGNSDSYSHANRYANSHTDSNTNGYAYLHASRHTRAVDGGRDISLHSVWSGCGE